MKFTNSAHKAKNTHIPYKVHKFKHKAMEMIEMFKNP